MIDTERKFILNLVYTRMLDDGAHPYRMMLRELEMNNYIYFCPAVDSLNGDPNAQVPRLTKKGAADIHVEL